MKIIVLDGAMRGSETPLGSDSLVVGSDAAADLRLLGAPGVEPFHCRIVTDEGRCWVENLAAPGGTQVLGKPPSNRIPLVAGDVVVAGGQRLVLAADGAQAAEVLAGFDAPSGGSDKPAAPERKPVVLLVDDDMDYLIYVQTLLQHQGYEVISASNGIEALIHIHEQVPDVVVCDVQMPAMDGFTLVRKLRQRPGLALVPVIMLTALDFDDVPARSLRLGADDFLVKERARMELEPRIRRALDRRLLAEAAIADAEMSTRASAAVAMSGSLEHVSVSGLLTLLEIERNTGELFLRNDAEGAEALIARLRVRAGAIVAARFEGQAEPRNNEVVYRVSEWKRGSFEFHPGPVEQTDEVKTSITFLLMEAARRRDEERRGEG